MPAMTSAPAHAASSAHDAPLEHATRVLVPSAATHGGRHATKVRHFRLARLGLQQSRDPQAARERRHEHLKRMYD
jgi:hypothetical protein